MAKKNNPYLPLYVGDWLSNNKLKMCTASAHGIMISIMCIMHKEETYGNILLKQKFKQNNKQISNFASQLAKLTSFDFDEIENSLAELVDEGVLIIDGDSLVCERMVKDADISSKRAESGRKGGNACLGKSSSKYKNFAQAKDKANTDIDIDINNDSNNEVVTNKNSVDEKLEKIIQAFHLACPDISKLSKISGPRKKLILAREKEYGLEKMGDVFRLVGESPFLNGENDKGWKANFDWIMNTNNFLKVLEGNYNSVPKNDKNEKFKRQFVGSAEALDKFKIE